MKKILLAVAGVVVVAVIGLLVAASMQPVDFRVERSRSIAAPPEAIWPLVSDFQRFNEWSPWHELDPNMKLEVGGAAGSVGHRYAWKGNGEVGAGNMTITEVKDGSEITVALEFTDPFASKATTRYQLVADGDKTKVTWSMWGKNESVMDKLFSLVFDMDAMIGADYDKGLAKLEAVLKGVRS